MGLVDAFDVPLIILGVIVVGVLIEWLVISLYFNWKDRRERQAFLAWLDKMDKEFEGWSKKHGLDSTEEAPDPDEE